MIGIVFERMDLFTSTCIVCLVLLTSLLYLLTLELRYRSFVRKLEKEVVPERVKVGDGKKRRRKK